MSTGTELTLSPPTQSSVAMYDSATLDNVFAVAKVLAKSRMLPKAFNTGTPEEVEAKVTVGIMAGMEVGLKPFQALQSIAVINGQPSLWGDGALSVVQAANVIEDFREEPVLDTAGKEIGYRCWAKRKGRASPIEHTFTIADATKANLINKEGPWRQYPIRMCQMRARAWTLRDGFSDVMKGFPVAEEAMDIVSVENIPPTGGATKAAVSGKSRATGALDAFASTDPEKSASASEPAPEAADGAVDAEFEDLPADGMPPEVAEAAGNGQWTAFVKWFEVQLSGAEPDDRQVLVDRYAGYLSACRAKSAKNLDTIDKLLAHYNVILVA